MINQDTSLPITISHLFIANWGGIDTPNSTRVFIIVFFGGKGLVKSLPHLDSFGQL